MPRNGAGTYSLPSGNPVVSGTTISSTVQNNTTSDIATALTNSIAKDGQTTPTANLPMGGFKLTGMGTGSAATDSVSLGQAQGQAYIYLGAVAGTDTITATTNPVTTSYVAGQTYRFVAAGTNTTATTININSLGAKSVTKVGATALAAGDILINVVYEVVYDGTQFQLINPNSVAAASVTAVALAASAYGYGDIKNTAFTVTMAASAATIALKTQAGTDPSATDPAEITFRNSSLTSNAWTKRAVTAALSTVISSGSTGGTTSAQPSRIMVLAIDNGGTVELAWCNYQGSSILDEATLISTTAEGGAGAADSANVIYSTTTRSNVPFVILGYFESTQATAGTWATNATVLQGRAGSALKSIQGILGSPTATTSGTSIDYTGIPSWVRRITIMFNGVSTNGTSNPLVQIGDAGGIETTGYLGAAMISSSGATPTIANFTAGWGINSGLAANVFHGSLVINLLDPANGIWVASGQVFLSSGTNIVNFGGSKPLSPGPLDRIRLTTVNGTDAFDAGSVNIYYE